MLAARSAGMPRALPERRPERDLDDARGVPQAGHRDQRRAGGVVGADGPEPLGPVAGDEGDVGQRLDVLDQGGTTGDALLAHGAQRDERGDPGIAVVDRVDDGRLLAGEEAVGGDHDLEAASVDPAALALGQCRGHVGHGVLAARGRRPASTRRPVAATDAPSSTRWGAWWRRSRSLPLAGSPSAPLATTTGDRPAATDRHFVPTGNQAPPWPRSPDWSTDSRSVRAGRSGRAPQRARWASRRTTSALPMPSRSRAGPVGRRHRCDPARTGDAAGQRARLLAHLELDGEGDRRRCGHRGDDGSAVEADDRARRRPRSRRCRTRATRRRPPGRPTSTTVSGVEAASARCMASVIRMLPWASGPDWLCDPLTWLVKGTAGTEPLPVAGAVDCDVPPAGAVVPVAAAPFLAASWASSDGEVPERWDQPGRRGPSSAKPAMTRVTTSAAEAAAVRRPRGSERPVVIRHAKAPSTAAVQTTSTNRTTGSWVSVPVPSAWTSGDGPAQVGEPVDEPPRGVADAVAQAARDEDGQQEVEGQRAEAHVDRPVGGDGTARRRPPVRWARTRRARSWRRGRR